MPGVRALELTTAAGPAGVWKQLQPRPGHADTLHCLNNLALCMAVPSLAAEHLEHLEHLGAEVMPREITFCFA